MATLIAADGIAREITPENGRAFTLGELQTWCDGYIQALRTSSGDWLYCNEDGKRLGLPINQLATDMMRDRIAADDYLVGDCVLCTPLEAGAEN